MPTLVQVTVKGVRKSSSDHKLGLVDFALRHYPRHRLATPIKWMSEGLTPRFAHPFNWAMYAANRSANDHTHSRLSQGLQVVQVTS